MKKCVYIFVNQSKPYNSNKIGGNNLNVHLQMSKSINYCGQTASQ